MFIYVHLLYRLERPASWVNLLTRHSLENAFLVWWRGGQEWMQSLASLAVERHAMDPRGFAWRLRGSTPPHPRALTCLGSGWKCKVFCTWTRLEMHANLWLSYTWFRVGNARSFAPRHAWEM